MRASLSILNFHCLQMLDAQMVSVDAVDEYGNTVLIVAAQNNNKKIVKVRKDSLLISMFVVVVIIINNNSISPLDPCHVTHLQAVLRRAAYSTPKLHPPKPNTFNSFPAVLLTIKTVWVKPAFILLLALDIPSSASTLYQREPTKCCAIREWYSARRFAAECYGPC
jgi:hypothetical protein